MKAYALGQLFPSEETRSIELKEIKGPNVTRPIIEIVDEYAVAFLNSEGGRIFWGVRDSDRVVVGVTLPESARDRLRKDVVAKLSEIQPQIDPTRFHLTFHPVESGGQDLFVVELEVPAGNSPRPYYTASHECFVRVDAVKKRLSGQQLTDWILTRASDASALPPDALSNADLSGLARRVRRIFEGHGMVPSHLPRFLAKAKAPFSISLLDLQDDRTLIKWLDEQKLEWLSETFLIRREWIDGEDEIIHRPFYFDKEPAQLLSTIDQYTRKLVWEDTYERPAAFFIRDGFGKEWERSERQEIFFVLRVPLVRLSDETTVYKYVSEVDSMPWNYGRTNIELRAWARLLFHVRGIHCYGSEMDRALAKKVCECRFFWHEIFTSGKVRRNVWHPEDYALSTTESRVSKDAEMLSQVIDFLKDHHLPTEPE